ncbi:MAG TPA: hypothetical protein PLU53_16000 [Bacteroidia bacterium]|nr:hypothetical protein [Bacteroidia bacterium]
MATWVISVYGYNNTCGKTSNTRSIGIKAQPGTPAAITGNAISCPATTAPYSIPALDGAATYTWSITGNASINSIGTPVVTTVPTISIDFGAGFTSGQLCVYGTNACGYQSPLRCKNIGTAPALPGAISGSATICSGVSSNYSILPVAGTNAYTWSVTGTGISISASGTAATVSTLPSFTNGSICVFAQGVCPAPAGTSPMRCKTLGTGKLSTPGNITGDPAFGVCDGTSIYSVNSLAGATAGYTWTLPSGASGSSNSNSIFIQFSDTFSIGQLCVHGNNVCGAGFDRCLTLYGGPAAPGSIAGNSTPCVGADEVFTWPAASGATHYQLFAPANVTFLTPNPTIDNYAVVNWNRIQAGTLSVVAANDCGESGSRGLTINPVACKMAPNSEIETAPSGSVFPDPSNGKFTLQFDNPKQDFTEYSLFVSEPGGRIILHTNGYGSAGP